MACRHHQSWNAARRALYGSRRRGFPLSLLLGAIVGKIIHVTTKLLRQSDISFFVVLVRQGKRENRAVFWTATAVHGGLAIF